MTSAESPESPFVSLKEVSRVFKSGASSVTALADVSLEIKRGERLALLGRSGSGKSTLLNLLGGLDRPSQGEIQVNEQHLDQLGNQQMAEFRLRSVGMIFQAFNLIGTKTAIQNVELPFVFAGETRDSRLPKAMAALEMMGLKDRAHHRPSELSGGEQQRVAIARALANEPPLILADEPTGNLDSVTAADIMEQLTEFSKNHNTTVLIVTHDEELASKFADRTLRLHDGKLMPPS